MISRPGSLHELAESRVALALVLLLAFVLRVAWWLTFIESIENEGVVYARLAENLFAGEGLISIFGGRDVMFPPGFPALIGLVATIVGSEEAAGRVIGLLCGTALVGVAYALTRHLFNARAAIVVAMFAAAHPLLVALSVSLYSEGPWIFFLLCATYGVVRSLTRPSTMALMGSGLIAGCGYLLRPEGLVFVAYFTIALVGAAALQRQSVIEIARRAGLFLAASLVIALPYVAYLSSLAGGLRWEGKSPYNNVQNERIRAGMTVPEAARGLDADGNPAGVFLGLHLDQAEQLRRPSGSASSLADTLLADPAVRLRRIVGQALTADFLSAPWVFVLAFVGVCVTPWWRTRFLEGITLIGVSTLQGLLLFTVDQSWTRYFFPLLPLLLMWSGAGLERVCGEISTRLVRQRIDRRPIVAYGLCSLAVAALVRVTAPPVRAVGDLVQAEDRVAREIGQWMADDAQSRSITGRPIVMGIGLSSTYYAGGTMRYLPYGDEHAALAHIHRMQPHYLVLRESDATSNQTPYAGQWIERGITDRCAVLARAAWSSSTEPARVWRWTCGAASQP